MNNNLITDETNNEFNTNCLALTIRKDYRLTIASNVFDTFTRGFFKDLFNIGMLNVLSLLL